MPAPFRKRLARKVFCTAAALLVFTVPASAASTWRVPQDFPTIQAAINAAANGDVIQVAAGTYYENLVWTGKALTVVGAGAASTIVDGQNKGRCLDMKNVPPAARVEGFTFTHGRAFNVLVLEDGGALRLANSSPTIAGNVIRDSFAGSGGGILLAQSDAVLAANLIAGNTARNNGGAVAVTGSSPLFVSNTIDGNTAGTYGGGVIVEGVSSVGAPASGVTRPTFVNDTLTRNRAGDPVGGSALFFWSTAARVLNTTVAGNSGGGIRLFSATKDGLSIANSIVWANPLLNGAPGYDFRVESGTFSVDHSIVGSGAWQDMQVVAGAAVLSQDPMFVELAAGDVHLRAGSPAVDSGSVDVPDLPPTDKDGEPRVFGAGVDMGAYELSAIDISPPVITPTVTGALGRDGWYVSDVTVTWTVADAESPVLATSGCDSTMVTSDTAGTRLTCTATSGGGTASVSVTIRRDATPPALACALDPAVLWPPDGRLVPVSARITVTDTNGTAIALTSATSSEPATVLADMQGFELGADDRAGLLRAARLGTGTGRVYTLVFEATDAAGNSSAQ